MLIAGNWKMNGLRSDLAQLTALRNGVEARDGVDVLLCPPVTLLTLFSDASCEKVKIGAQDCHALGSGAHTGDISSEMLADAGADYVIVGHSERRCDHAEKDSDVLAKTMAVHRAGLKAIVCVGESLEIRETGQAEDHVLKQVRGSVPEGATPENTVIAYEPVWAIGTGHVASENDILAMHGAIREQLIDMFSADGKGFKILYGGSVKPDNATGILGLENVGGALVGGASLKAEDFLRIIAAANPV